MQQEVRHDRDQRFYIKLSLDRTRFKKGVIITVNKGDVVVVIGPSGSGKTTMLRCINFLERADAGTITVEILQ